MCSTFFQVQCFDHCKGIGGIVVHVVALTDLRPAAVATPVVRNDAVAMLNEEQHLRIPIVAGEWPPWWNMMGCALLRPQTL